jgi:hypothetical protein
VGERVSDSSLVEWEGPFSRMKKKVVRGAG